MEEVQYRQFSEPTVKSNSIKIYLHQILTIAIFNYSPCKELIETYDEKRKPKIEIWEGNSQKWETLSVDPYHIVSKFYLTLYTLKFNLLTNLFMQQLTVWNSDQLKAGHGPPFQPLFGNIDYQLKRRALWPSLEIHVVYALFYILCTNKNGYLEFKKYLLVKDKNVFDPHFIAQYLLAPVNTIVKTWLLPWMMEPWEDLKSDPKTKNQY